MEENAHISRKDKAAMMYESFRVFMYNKEKGEVMGRNAESWGMWWNTAAMWEEIQNFCGSIKISVCKFNLIVIFSFIGKIGLFFLVYYACLAAFFAAMFAIAFSTIPDTKDGPKYTSFISDKPCKLK